MRLVTILFLVAVATGCGKREESPTPSTNGSDGESPAAKRSVTTKRSGDEPVGTKVAPLPPSGIKARLMENLPPGGRFTFYGEEEDSNTLFSASWSRPGFMANSAWFSVRKAGHVVTVKSVGDSEWVFENEKLKSELAGDAPEKQWDWLKQRAAEVAAATYKAYKQEGR